MVLPSPAAIDPAKLPTWCRRLIGLAELAVRGVLVLVEAGEQASIRVLMRAFADAGRPLHIVLDVAALSDVPVGDTVVLCVRPDDAVWLNRQRPRFAHRRLRVFLWVSSATAADLRERAPDFFDWISHYQAVPPALPVFVRRVVDLPVPGLLVEGTADEANALLADCGITAPPTVIDGQQYFAALVDALRAHTTGWRILRGIDGAFWARRARWALAEANTRAHTIFAGESIHSPGWLPWSASTLDLWAAAAQLTAAGLPDAATVAVACELEPAAVALACWLAQAGAWDDTARAALHADDVGAALSSLAAARSTLPSMLRNSAAFVRAAITTPALRVDEAAYKRALQRGHLCDPDALAIVTARARWTRPEPSDDEPPIVRGWHIEALLRGGWRSARAYLAYARAAGALGHADAQMTWVLRGCGAPRADDLIGELMTEFGAAAAATNDLDLFAAVFLESRKDLRVRETFGVAIDVHIRLIFAEKRILRRQFAEADTLLHDALAAAAGDPDLEADVCEDLADLADLRGDAAATSAWKTRARTLRPGPDPAESPIAEDRAQALLDQEDWNGAETVARAGLAALTDHDPPARKTHLLDHLATALDEQNRVVEAADAYVVLRNHLRAHGGTRSYTAFAADATLVGLWIRLGRLDEASALLQERAPELVRLFGEDHLLGVLFEADAVELALARQDWVAAESAARRLATVTHRVHGPTAGEHLHALALLGRSLLRQGRVADAISPLRTVHAHQSALWPGDPEIAVEAIGDLAQALRQHGEAEQTVTLLRELQVRVRMLPAAQRSRHLFDIVFRLGDNLTMHGRMLEACDLYLQAISEDPQQRRAYLAIGSHAFMFCDRGPRWEAMIRNEITRDVANDHGWSIHAYGLLAAYYRQRRRWSDAEAALRASLALQTPKDPTYVHTLHDLYQHLRQFGRLAEAIEVLRDLLARPLPRAMYLGDPTYLRGELADLLLIQKDFPAAEIAAADPKLAGPRMFALYKQGKDAELELCARAVLDTPGPGRRGDVTFARLFLALLELHRGDIDAALTILREIAAGDPEGPAVGAARFIAGTITVSRILLKSAVIADIVRAGMEYQIVPPKR